MPSNATIRLSYLLLIITSCLSIPVNAMYIQGCADPNYLTYMEKRFAFFAQNNQRMYSQTLREYQRTSALPDSTFERISALTRHLKYSAQLDPIDEVEQKIADLFQYSEAMSMEKRIAGFVLDEFSSENHAINMAKAWVAYRQGDIETTEQALMAALDVKEPLLLSAFGPDFSLVRQLYQDGYVDMVKAYIQKTRQFWRGKSADELRFVWRQMMILQCPIQFESTDIVKAISLGLRAGR